MLFNELTSILHEVIYFEKNFAWNIFPFLRGVFEKYSEKIHNLSINANIRSKLSEVIL